MTAAAPDPVFDHLLRLTDRRGTFEHACFAEPRLEHGYCADDMARVLVVATREPDADREVNRLAGVALRFLDEAQALSGACRNRMDCTGRWADEPGMEDCWGRCIWGLGTAAAHSDVAWVGQSAVGQFERAAQQRSTSPRAMAFAALGAAELLAVDPEHRAARELITEYETADGGHLSPTPVAGRGAQDVRPGFDQQPIEVSTLADACARAAAVDANPIWSDGVRAAAAWFLGANDAGELMWDPETGGGFDGLHADRVNRNQGAESTLAVLSTFQHARRFSTVPQ